MTLVILINIFFAGFSFYVAERYCTHWSGAWWLNIVASGMNMAAVLRAVIPD